MKIWNLQRAILVGPPMRHDAAAVSCTFSPVENALVTCSASLNSPTDDLRIWDASNFQPISPNMSIVGFSELYPSFSPSGARIQFADGRGYDLKADSHSPEDLSLLAQLLSGRKIDAAVGAVPLSRAELESAWTRLRVRFPDVFEIPVESVLRWHEQQLDRANAAHEAYEIKFHRHCLAVELARFGWRPKIEADSALDTDSLICRLSAIACDGHSSEAAKVAVELAGRHPSFDFGAARVLAVASADQSLPPDRAAHFINDAVRLLCAAENAGVLHAWQLEDVPDFDSLKGRTPFEEFEREVDAKAKVNALFDSLLLKSEVIKQLKVDATLTDRTRAFALSFAASKKEDMQKLAAASWEMVAPSGSSPEAYKLGLRLAEAAFSINPDEAIVMNTLGVARCRVGQYADGIIALTRSDERNSKSKDGRQPADVAFLAMRTMRSGMPARWRHYSSS